MDLFVVNELQVFANTNEKMVLIPSYIADEKKITTLPSNVTVDDSLCRTKQRFAQSVMPHLATIFRKEFLSLLCSCEGLKSFRRLRRLFSSVTHGLMVKDYMERNIRFKQGDTVYTYWLAEDALGALFYIKDKGKPFRFVSRAHRYDVYEEKVGSYMPLRKEIFKAVDRVYVVSGAGTQFLHERYEAFSQKIFTAHLGVFKYDVLPSSRLKEAGEVRFLSCSYVVPVKRVELMYSSIVAYCDKNPNKKITWTHIGEGAGLAELTEIVSDAPANLSVIFTGEIPPEGVIDIYRTQYFDVFVNISLSEGVPVSIMEALSFGVPVVATDAGGNGEIVNDETGVLIPIYFDVEEFCVAVDKCIEGRERYAETIPVFYEREFNAAVNYERFYSDFLKYV